MPSEHLSAPRPPFARLSPRRKNLLTILFLALTPLCFFWRETLGLLALGDQDAVFWFLPLYNLVATQIRAGGLPLWNPWMYGGMPLFAQLQAGALDPFNWLFLSGGGLRTLTFAQEAAFAVALLAAYAYARALGGRRRAGVVTALVYGLSGFPVARTIYPGLLHIYALAPLPLLCIERLWRDAPDKNRWRWREVICGALVVAWQLCAGHPQPFLYAALLAAAYALFRAFTPAGSPFSRLRFLTQCALLYALGAALSAVQMFPAIAFTRQSVRETWTYEMFTAHSLHPLSLAGALFPFMHGGGRGIYPLPYQVPFQADYWHHNEAQIYLGALTLALALTGALTAWRARWRPGFFWACAVIAGALLSLGKFVPPLAAASYHIPLLGQFRSPNRHWMEVTLGVAVLAGYAVERFLTEQNEQALGLMKRRLRASIVAITLFCTLFALRHTPSAEFVMPVALALAACLCVWDFTHGHRARGGMLIPVFLLFDFLHYAYFAPINSAMTAAAETGQAFPAELKPAAGDAAPWRFHFATNKNTGWFRPDWFAGFEMAPGYDPLLSAAYKTFSGIDEAGHTYLPETLGEADQTLDLLSVRYALVPHDFALATAPARWRRVARQSPLPAYQEHHVYENQRRLPRAWLVNHVAPAWQGDQLKMIRGALPGPDGQRFDPRRHALAEPAAATRISQALAVQGAAAAQTEARTGEVTLSRHAPGSLSARVTASHVSLLVLSEIAWPGWQARVDGVKTEVFQVDYLLSGVVAPRGEHLIEFYYEPPFLRTGLQTTTAAGVILLLLFVSDWRGGKKRPAETAY
ncbi:MAG: YfhO family protein [Blastocatellia bacterium]